MTFVQVALNMNDDSSVLIHISSYQARCSREAGYQAGHGVHASMSEVYKACQVGSYCTVLVGTLK